VVLVVEFQVIETNIVYQFYILMLKKYVYACAYV